MRKVSYVESEESEDIDESKKKKSQKVQSSNVVILKSCICFLLLALVQEILSVVPLLDLRF